MRRDGTEVHLTKTEFRLLCELASSPGRVFSREVLLERVWGYGYFGDGRLVDVHVRRLRTKIEADPANPRHVVDRAGAGLQAPGVKRLRAWLARLRPRALGLRARITLAFALGALVLSVILAGTTFALTRANLLEPARVGGAEPRRTSTPRSIKTGLPSRTPTDVQDILLPSLQLPNGARPVLHFAGPLVQPHRAVRRERDPACAARDGRPRPARADDVRPAGQAGARGRHPAPVGQRAVLRARRARRPPEHPRVARHLAARRRRRSRRWPAPGSAGGPAGARCVRWPT